MRAVILFSILIGILNSTFATTIPFTSSRWVYDAETHVAEKFQGTDCLYLKNGTAKIADANFLNGIIEFDILVVDSLSFPGLTFRGVDSDNYEEFYLRPWLSGFPDATQYAPVVNGLSAWQLYCGQAYSANVRFTFGAWLHTKIVVSDNIAEVYFNNESNPTHSFYLKRSAEKGSIGLKTNFAGTRFANFHFEQLDQVKLSGTPVEEHIIAEDVIQSWAISSVFNEAELTDKPTLPAELLAKCKWSNYKVEKIGLLNIATTSKKEKDNNTVLAKIVIQSDKAEVKKLNFGYSDRCRVYLNGKLLYAGNNIWQSRDYKFLGTIGLHDAVYLSLEEGTNEVVIAVSESFGGWGIIGKLN